MPTLTYTNSAFVTLTRISSSVMNQYFTDITTWANTTKLDYLNLQTAGVRASNISSQSSAAGLPLLADGAGAATFSTISTIHSAEILNASLTATVGSNLLTVSLKTAAGADATASTPIRIGFRNSTAATGTFQDRTITAALSVNTVAIGCTLGLVSAQNQYIYVYAIDNAGTVELALAGSRCFDEGTTYNTTAINGSSTNALVLYSTAARTGVAVRLIGRLKSNQSTSGTYVTSIAEISLQTSYQDKHERSRIIVNTPNGHGSTNNKIRIYTATKQSAGTAITYATSATLGDTFTINEDGLYTMTLYDVWSAGAAEIGISKNSNQLTTTISSVTDANRLIWLQTPSAGIYATVSTTQFLQTGDVIRSHGSGQLNGTTALAEFQITKLTD